MSQHPGNRTVRVRFADGEWVYVKVATDGDGRRIRRATGVLRYLGEHGDVRTPHVLAARTRCEPCYLATAALRGGAIVYQWSDASVSERASMLYRVGRAMANLHAVEVERSGRIVDGTRAGLSLAEDTWVDVICATIDERERTVFSDRFAVFPERVKRVLIEHREAIEAIPVALLHGDPNRKNCLVPSAPAAPVGLVDWEESLVGDPSFDLCRVEATQIEQPPVSEPDRLRRAFRNGYRARAGSLPAGHGDREDLYRVVTFLKPAQTFDMWAPEAAEDTAALETWIRGEMARRIDAVETDR